MQQRAQIGSNQAGKLQSPMIEAHTKAMQTRLPTDRQAAGSSNRGIREVKTSTQPQPISRPQDPAIENPHEGKTDTPPDRSANERHLQRANAKPEQLTRENENAHDLFGYKKSTQENPCAINIDTL